MFQKKNKNIAAAELIHKLEMFFHSLGHEYVS